MRCVRLAVKDAARGQTLKAHRAGRGGTGVVVAVTQAAQDLVAVEAAVVDVETGASAVGGDVARAAAIDAAAVSDARVGSRAGAVSDAAVVIGDEGGAARICAVLARVADATGGETDARGVWRAGVGGTVGNTSGVEAGGLTRADWIGTAAAAGNTAISSNVSGADRTATTWIARASADAVSERRGGCSRAVDDAEVAGVAGLANTASGTGGATALRLDLVIRVAGDDGFARSSGDNDEAESEGGAKKRHSSTLPHQRVVCL